MKNKRRNHSAQFKAKVALAAVIDKMTEQLRRMGHQVNHKRIRRLMRQMGLEAVYPRRRRGLSIPEKQHKIYPYLLRDVQVIRPDQVWSADITYIRLYRGWLYLVAVKTPSFCLDFR